MSLNLLNLPSVVLEEILMKCLKSNGKWNFIKLTECCKFLKEFIENSPRLRSQFYLKLEIGTDDDLWTDYKSIEQYRENLTALMASSRKYTEISLMIRNPDTFCDIENEDLNFKALFDKYASTITKFQISLCSVNLIIISKAFSFLEKMKNLKEFCWWELNEDLVEPCDNNETAVFAENHFEKLEHVEIHSSDVTACSLLLKQFQLCRNIQSLDLHSSCEFEVDILLPLLKNCRKTLTYFEFNVRSCDFIKFLKELKVVGLNLERFDLGLHQMSEEKFLLLIEFLETQKNLKELSLSGKSTLNFVIRLGEILNYLESLTEVKLYLFCSEDPLVLKEYDWKAWNITRIERLELEITHREIQTNRLAEKIFQSPSNKLKFLDLDGLDFQGNIFERIVKNCNSLQELYMYDCHGVKSNEIFLILKHLKKLIKLTFGFSPGCPLDSTLFDTNEDLVLPNIQDDRFDLNEFISSSVLSNLAKCIENVSNLNICPVLTDEEDIDLSVIVNRDYKTNLNLLTRELNNLKHLTYEGLEEETATFENAFVDKIQSNLKNFNKNPALFVFKTSLFEKFSFFKNKTKI